MSARDLIRRYVSLLGDSWTPRATTDARVEQVYAAVRAEVLREEARRLRRLADEMSEVGRARQAEGLYRAALVLEERADEAGKDTRKGESTRATSPWQRAVDGLNALTDAEVDFHIEPDGHIANPSGDEHIEWDRKAQRWRLVHDDEDGSAPDPGMTAAELAAAGPGAYQCRCGHGSNVHGPFCFAQGCQCGSFTHRSKGGDADV
ncbi:hypothetical protein [Streptomyces paromomycinus]|uniref:Uncharacterized protein n=1 Tax=Streptomyces paromomycinus TaxID=92743 RepID=A0A401WA14_STREY|nr:hypothetical protein [Streptomyces paromomycinus]GCD46154.1 hypothetical protein GKJPGBOP_05901 [Streptomyces paromomycinus]